MCVFHANLCISDRLSQLLVLIGRVTGLGRFVAPTVIQPTKIADAMPPQSAPCSMKII